MMSSGFHSPALCQFNFLLCLDPIWDVVCPHCSPAFFALLLFFLKNMYFLFVWMSRSFVRCVVAERFRVLLLWLMSRHRSFLLVK